jgi:hypothetical protein
VTSCRGGGQETAPSGERPKPQGSSTSTFLPYFVADAMRLAPTRPATGGVPGICAATVHFLCDGPPGPGRNRPGKREPGKVLPGFFRRAFPQAGEPLGNCLPFEAEGERNRSYV